MTEYKSVFIDTAPFIYLVEEHPSYFKIIENLLEDYKSLDSRLFTSVITYMEFCVVPERDGRKDLIEKFNNFILNLNIEITEINLNIAKKAYKLRSLYSNLKGLDAMQLACALENECSLFITNDMKFKKIKEISIKTLE